MDNVENKETVLLDVTDTPTLQQLEQRYIMKMLDKAGGNKVKAAEMLGVSVKTIYNKLNSYVTTQTAQP